MKTQAAFITCLLAALFCIPAAHAAVVMTLEQVGSNVVATGSGTVDLTGLTDQVGGNQVPNIHPSAGFLLEGDGGNYAGYGTISGPRSFGTGDITLASSGSGDPLAIYGEGELIVIPTGYTSGTPLSSTATWDNTTLAALGVTPGTYTWTWGSGADADSLTLYAGVPAPSSVPEPASLALLGAGLSALALLTRRKK